MRAAFEAVEADCCTVVIPPAARREAVMLAMVRATAQNAER